MSLVTERSLGKARKLDRAAALADARAGKTCTAIAAKQGVAVSSVFRFLQRINQAKHEVVQYRAQRADVLANIQAKALDVQARILDSLDDAVLASLTASQKSGLLHSINTVAGTMYDKERLETGQSTANISAVTKLVSESVKSLYRKAPKVSPEQAIEQAAVLEQAAPQAE